MTYHTGEWINEVLFCLHINPLMPKRYICNYLIFSYGNKCYKELGIDLFNQLVPKANS